MGREQTMARARKVSFKIAIAFDGGFENSVPYGINM